METTIEIIKIVATITLAAFGWIIVHLFNSKRDLKNKLLEFRLNRLYQAFINLYNFVGEQVSQQTLDDFKRALADIQLFGNKKQVEYAHNLQESLAKSTKKEEFNLGDLLTVLRDSIREDLNLEELDFKPFKPLLRIKPRDNKLDSGKEIEVHTDSITPSDGISLSKKESNKK